MDSSIVGVDISKSKFDVAMLVGDKVWCKVYSNDKEGFAQFSAWLKSRNVDPHVCMESTSYYGLALATNLHENGYRVSMVNPARIKGFSSSELSRTKTDKADAKMIARFCRAMKPGLWAPEEKWQVELKQLSAYVDKLKVMLRMEENRLAGACNAVAKAIKKHIRFIEKQIEETTIKIDELIKSEPALAANKKLLKTIPGVGDVTVAQVLASLGDVKRFKSAKQITAYAGLNPRHRQSGSSIKGHSSISKQVMVNYVKRFICLLW